MINHDATLGQQLFHIAVGETVAQLPAHRDHDDILRKSEPSKARSWCWSSNTATTHHFILPGPCLHRCNRPGNRGGAALSASAGCGHRRGSRRRPSTRADPVGHQAHHRPPRPAVNPSRTGDAGRSER
jgi:hypothetical protein